MYALGQSFGMEAPVVSMFQNPDIAWESFFSAVSQNIPVTCEFQGMKDGKYCIGTARYFPATKEFHNSWH